MVILIYSKLINHSQKVPRISAPSGNVEKNKAASQWGEGDQDIFSNAHHSHPSLFLSFILLLVIFLLGEGTFPTQPAVLLPASLFYTGPTRKEGASWHKLHSEICVFGGLFDLCKDLSILTWS